MGPWFWELGKARLGTNFPRSQRLELTLDPPATADAHLRVAVAGHWGNITRVDRTFASVQSLIFEDG